MISFLLRRTLSTALVLLVVTFILYLLLDLTLDYYFDLRASTAPNIEELFANRDRLLGLDTPVIVRYLQWLLGASGCLVGTCDLGTAWYVGQDVTSQLPGAIANTIKLVALATFVSIVIGVFIGMVSAIRQYTGFDYFITFLNFLLYSLPVFWVAVLLKQYGAIEFNNFLADPVVGWGTIIVVSLLAGLAWTAALGGGGRRRAVSFVGAAAVTLGTIWVILATGWLNNPSFGILGVAALGLVAALVTTYLSTGFGNRRSLLTAFAVAVIGICLYFPLLNLFYYVSMNWLWMALLIVVAIGIGIGVGLLFRGPDPWVSARTGAITAGLMSLVVFADRVLQEWPRYNQHPAINNRPIATIGASTPNLSGSFWMENLDTFTHLLLPSIALVCISIASYTRYTRGSMLEVLGQDYIRTARAKGLPERTVIMRHALRNALLPLASVVPVDIITMIGGAVITETIFGWNGMGKLFIDSMNYNELDPIMAYIVITGLLAVIANLVADFLYAVLDPRIRVNA